MRWLWLLAMALAACGGGGETPADGGGSRDVRLGTHVPDAREATADHARAVDAGLDVEAESGPVDATDEESGPVDAAPDVDAYAACGLSKTPSDCVNCCGALFPGSFPYPQTELKYFQQAVVMCSTGFCPMTPDCEYDEMAWPNEGILWSDAGGCSACVWKAAKMGGNCGTSYYETWCDNTGYALCPGLLQCLQAQCKLGGD